MNLRKTITGIFLLLASLAMAVPTIVVDLDVQRAEVRQGLTFLQATTPRVEFRILQGGQPVRGLTGYTGSFKYGDDLTPSAGWVTVASSNTDAVNSRIRFDFDGADTNTNGTFKAVVQILDGSGGIYYFGTLNLAITESTANTGADTLELGSTVDWSGTTYTNGVSAGPYSAGTNITFAAGSGGKVVVNSKVVGTAAAGRVLYGDADGTWKALAAGTSGQVLTSSGAAAPAWTSAGVGDITGVTAGTGLTGGGTSGDVSLALANTAVSAGSYTFSALTIDAQGRITAAASGTPVPDGDKGDLTVGGGAWTIDAGAVTLAKQANLAQATVIGRALGAGTGTPTALTAAQLAAVVEDADVFLPLVGGSLSGNLSIYKNQPTLIIADTTSPVGDPSISIQRAVSSYPQTVGKIEFIDWTSEAYNAQILATASTATRGKMELKTSNNAGTLTTALTLDHDQSATFAGTITGNGSGLTNLDATDLTGDIPAASFGATVIEATDRDLHLYTVEEVGWASAYANTVSAVYTLDCVKSANTSEQDAVLHTDMMVTPRGFTAYATTGALVIDWMADSTTLADIRGIRVLGFTSVGASPVEVYNSTTTRNVGATMTPATISIDAASFTTATVYAFYRIEILVTVEDGFCVAIISARLVSQ